MRIPRRAASALATAALALLAPLATAALAQVRASELGTMSQVIDGTRLTVEYSRPRLRGRDAIFGTKYVRWGETWTPGANWATTLELSGDVQLDGIAVPKGKYSVWMVVREHGDWTMILDPRWHRFHEDKPDSTAQQIRVAVRPETAPTTDVLTWWMPALRMEGGTLAMQWSTVRVPIDVEVRPSLRLTTPANVAQAYLGSYDLVAAYKNAMPPRVDRLLVSYTKDGVLEGSFPRWSYFRRFALVQIAPDWFVPGVYDEQGQVYEVIKPGMTFEFRRDGGKAASFVIRNEGDSLDARGTRLAP